MLYLDFSSHTLILEEMKVMAVTQMMMTSQIMWFN